MADDVLMVAVDGGREAAAPWVEAFARRLPDLAVAALGDAVDPARVRYVAAWKHPHGALAALPALGAVFSLGAGVDHLLADPGLPADVPVARVVDPDLTNRMSEWVLLQVLGHHRQARRYARQQAEARWDDDARQPAARAVRVGVMGLGVLGLDAAAKLALVGFDVAGWSRSRRAAPGLACYAGATELDAVFGIREFHVSRATRDTIEADVGPDAVEASHPVLMDSHGLTRDRNHGLTIRVDERVPGEPRRQRLRQREVRKAISAMGEPATLVDELPAPGETRARSPGRVTDGNPQVPDGWVVKTERIDRRHVVTLGYAALGTTGDRVVGHAIVAED